ncbi:MAG: hypothetical protein ACUVR0_04005 [Candidatus Aminicenantales bacterium]
MPLRCTWESLWGNRYGYDEVPPFLPQLNPTQANHLIFFWRQLMGLQAIAQA